LEFLYENSLANNYWRFKPHKKSHSIITYENYDNKGLFFFLVIKWFSKPLDLGKSGLIINKKSFPEEIELSTFNEELYPQKKLPSEDINYTFYYSPFIRNKELDVEENHTNISTGNLLKHTISKKDSPYINQINSYQRNEFRSFIKLLQSPIKNNLPFNTDNINIALKFNLPSFNSNSTTTIQAIKKRLSYLLYTDDLEILNLLYDRRFKYIKGLPSEQKKLSLLKSITFNLLHFFAFNIKSTFLPALPSKPLSSNLELYKKVKHFNQNEKKIKPEINEYINILREYITTTITPNAVLCKEITITHILNFFFELIENETTNFLNFYVSTLLSSDKVEEAFKQERVYNILLEKTFENKFEQSSNYKHTKLLYTDIQNMSSGEKHYFQLFSRFYELRTTTMMDNTESLLILIDEGETSLHPQWQKQYIKLLKETLPLIFNKTSIQIILTSHSPFIVSDLPKENIIFLDTDEQNNTQVVDGLKQKETFGANIHTLLTDAFFMDGGLMGDFAKEQINAVIDFLNNKPSFINNAEEAQKYIHLIGEPIIKRQLQKMLDSLRLSDVEVVKKRMAVLEEEMSELNNKLSLLSPNTDDTNKL
jgi:hypothetical protein